MTDMALAELNRLEDSDDAPPARIKHITLESMIAYADEQGWKWFDFKDYHYRKVGGRWKGTFRETESATATATAGEVAR